MGVPRAPCSLNFFFKTISVFRRVCLDRVFGTAAWQVVNPTRSRLLGLSGKDFFLLFLTLAGGLTCCSLYVACRLGRAACQSSRRKRRFATIRPRRGGGRPMRLAAEDDDEFGEEDDDIIGD